MNRVLHLAWSFSMPSMTSRWVPAWGLSTSATYCTIYLSCDNEISNEISWIIHQIPHNPCRFGIYLYLDLHLFDFYGKVNVGQYTNRMDPIHCKQDYNGRKAVHLTIEGASCLCSGQAPEALAELLRRGEVEFLPGVPENGCSETWTRWWFQTFFIFTSAWGNDPIWRAYYSNGLKPPTSETCWNWCSWGDVRCLFVTSPRARRRHVHERERMVWEW